jgi:uncharacterized protein (TIGR02391 family)
MSNLLEIISDPDNLLAMAPEELSRILLNLTNQHLQNGIVQFSSLKAIIDVSIYQKKNHTQNILIEIELALAEAWNWLMVQGILIPAAGVNGNNGWVRLGRKARNLLELDSFYKYANSVAFPKSLLHPLIADHVWLDLARGEYDTAVFKAFKQVEIAVRQASNFSQNEYGTDLMRKAFGKNGALTIDDQSEGERDALAHLFAGAIGSYKNPHSHRTVAINDFLEAQEMVVLASHLFRIVESRSKSKC